MDGTALAEKIQSGEISAAEAVEAAIRRAGTVNPSINAIVTETFGHARKKAAMNLSGPFAGVPAFIKDTDDAEEAPTLMGSRAIPDHVKKRNSAYVKQFLSLGFVSLGKSSLPEFGLTATTEPYSSGPTRNPWNPDYSTGGSSGGSAALVAAGVVPVAHGNDGGGSIRIPAACCGLVGLKSTRGRLKPMEGTEIMPVKIVHQGMLSRTVRDTARFFAGAEQYWRNPKLPPVGLVEHPGKKRLAIGLFTQTPLGKPCHPESAELTLKIASLCEELGHSIREIPSPFDGNLAGDFASYWGMMAFSIRFYGRFMMNPGFDRSKIDPWTLGLSRLYQKNILKTPFIIGRLKHAAKKFQTMFDTFDVLMCPTLAHPTPRIGYIGPDVPFDEAFERVLNYASFTPPQNVSGTPAITLPLGTDGNSMPLGVQFASGHGMERQLLELAFELEEAQPWAMAG
jgi:amidase